MNTHTYVAPTVVRGGSVIARTLSAASGTAEHVGGQSSNSLNTTGGTTGQDPT